MVYFSIPFVRLAVVLNMVCAFYFYGRRRAEIDPGPASPKYQALANSNKFPIYDAILGTIPASVETIQALLNSACYSEKGWMFTSMATRMALDLDVPKAYGDITATILESGVANPLREAAVFRKARVWFGTFVLANVSLHLIYLYARIEKVSD